MDSSQLAALFAQLSWVKTLGIGVLLAGLYYVGLFNDGKALQSQLVALQQQHAESEKDIASTKEALANADRFEREVKDTVDQFATITDFMPEKIGGSELITLISDLCKKTGLKLVKVEPKPGGERIEFYETSKVQFGAEGSFAQILAFLSGLTRIPKLMTIDDFVIDMLQSNTAQDSPRLFASGVLLGYRYVRTPPHGEAKPGDANGSAQSN